MKIRVLAELEKNELPKDYRRLVMSLLKHALTELNEGMFFEEFYKSTEMKDFTFAVKLQKPKFMSEIILLESKFIEMNFSTSNMKKALILQNAFLNIKNSYFSLNNNSLKVMNVIARNKKIVKDNEITIRMISPLCIRVHNPDTNKDIYYSTNNSDFHQVANEIINKQNEDILFGSKLVLEAISPKKTVVTHYGISIECSLGVFKLSGETKLLQKIVDSGIGSRSGAGFGMVEII